MPAKIRKIKGNITLGDHYNFAKSLTGTTDKSVAVFEFNKSIKYKGGTLGKFKAKRLPGDNFLIKVKQDLNNDGKFAKNELIYKGKVSADDNADALINFEGTIKIKKQMHNCTWDLQKNPKNLTCTADYIPEYSNLMLKPSNPEQLLDIDFPLFGVADYDFDLFGG